MHLLLSHSRALLVSSALFHPFTALKSPFDGPFTALKCPLDGPFTALNCPFQMAPCPSENLITMYLHFDEIPIFDDDIRVTLEGREVTDTIVDGNASGKRNPYNRQNENVQIESLQNRHMVKKTNMYKLESTHTEQSSFCKKKNLIRKLHGKADQKLIEKCFRHRKGSNIAYICKII